MLEVKKTHTVVKNPQIDVRYLSDYMAASEQVKRRIVRDCKYKPIARILQHDDAKNVVARALVNGTFTADHLLEKAEWLSGKLSSDEFEKKKNEVNADYLRQLAKVVAAVALPTQADILPPGPSKKFKLEGVIVTFSPEALLRRVTKTNKLKVGALMLRYAKGADLPPATGECQSAAIFGCLSAIGDDDGSEPEKALCLTLDAHSGQVYAAPGKAGYIFNEMKAVCQGIAERWPLIKPPKGAIY